MILDMIQRKVLGYIKPNRKLSKNRNNLLGKRMKVPTNRGQLISKARIADIRPCHGMNKLNSINENEKTKVVNRLQSDRDRSITNKGD